MTNYNPNTCTVYTQQKQSVRMPPPSVSRFLRKFLKIFVVVLGFTLMLMESDARVD